MALRALFCSPTLSGSTTGIIPRQHRRCLAVVPAVVRTVKHSFGSSLARCPHVGLDEKSMLVGRLLQAKVSFWGIRREQLLCVFFFPRIDKTCKFLHEKTTTRHSTCRQPKRIRQLWIGTWYNVPLTQGVRGWCEVAFPSMT